MPEERWPDDTVAERPERRRRNSTTPRSRELVAQMVESQREFSLAIEDQTKVLREIAGALEKIATRLPG